MKAIKTLTHAAESVGSAAVREGTAADLRIDELKLPSLPALMSLAAHSHLPTLTNAECLRRYLEREVVFGGYLGERLVGCCCIERDVRKKYLTAAGEGGEFPLPNLYFCGAFVLPQYRQYGIGGKLYQHRLDYALTRFRAPVIVELLGDGTPSSVDAGSMVGYRFYLRNGFKELGYSVDADAGKIVLLELS